MGAAQGGDQQAYARLLHELTPVLRRMVGSRAPTLAADDVEDVVQEILLSVHAVRATYDVRRPFFPWLVAIARNRTLDALRRRRRLEHREVGLEHADVTFREVASNTEMDGGDPELLSRAIGQLPPGQRQAITLLKLDGRSLREASAQTGLSEGALKVATHRAMQALRRTLTGE